MKFDSNHIPIRQWAEDDRPREKLLLKGKHSLSNAELIAILIGSGNKEDSALDLAKKILQQTSNNLVELSKLLVSDLKKINGIGQVKSLIIIAALELGKRSRESESLLREKITSSKDVFEIMQSKLSGSRYEAFWILLLDRANKIISTVQVSEGGISGTVADPKKIYKIALDHHASSLILCHNHPSGNVQPSEADTRLTNKLQQAGNFLDMPVLDHIIIGEGNYFSFADNNKI
jgi:DNA repair protein RadC